MRKELCCPQIIKDGRIIGYGGDQEWFPGDFQRLAGCGSVTGSNIAVPLCFIAKFHGSHFVYIETRAKVYNKTISGKIVERFADKVIVQWPEMVDVYKGHAEYYGTLV